MWQVDVPEERKKLTLTLASSIHEDLEAFVTFIQQQQPDAPLELIVEKILSEFFASRRQPMPAFRSWQEETLASKADAKIDTASCHDAESSAKAAFSGPSNTPKLRLPSPATEGSSPS